MKVFPTLNAGLFFHAYLKLTASCLNVMETVAELMWDENLLPRMSQIHVESQATLEMLRDRDYTFSELHQAKWWIQTQMDIRHQHGDDSYLLPIILHIDATQLDATGKHSATPVNLTLGNFSYLLRVSDIAS